MFEEIVRVEAMKKLLLDEAKDNKWPEERFRRLKLGVKIGMEMKREMNGEEGMQKMLDGRIQLLEERKERVSQEKKAWENPAGRTVKEIQKRNQPLPRKQRKLKKKQAKLLKLF